MFFDLIDKNLVNYWQKFQLTENDFYCKKCNQLMLNINEIKDVHVKILNNNDYIFYKYNRISDKYIESENNRWLIYGKFLSINKIRVFRQICWPCFFKMLFEKVDVKKYARRSKWYKKILNNNLVIPAASVSSAEYFSWLFNITDEQLNIEKQKFDTASEIHFINKYGEKEGLEKYKQYQARQAYTCSKEYMQKTRNYSDDDWNKFNALRASTKENFIRRYGKDDGLKRWYSYCKHESYAGNSLEYFIQKYGLIEGEQKYKELNKRKAITEQNLINKYGIEEGSKKWKEYKSKYQLGYSNISQKLFMLIDDKYEISKTSSHYATKNKEDFVTYLDKFGQKRIYSIDYTLGNKIIEFNGDLWHANPLKYSENDVIHYGTFNKTAKEIWEYDRIRIEYLKSIGYKIKIVWESEFSKNQNKIVDECIVFLQS